MTKVKIYGALRSRANRNMWAAEELGVAYDLVSTDISKGEQKTPEFLAINPNGHVPAMVDGDLVLCESLAINLYLAKKAGGPMAPKDLAEDARMTMWSVWAITEVEKYSLEYLLHTVLFPPEKRDPAAPKAALEALHKPMKVLEAALAAGGGYLVGGRFTIADLNVATVVTYVRGVEDFMKHYPGVAAWIAAAQSRPGYKQAMTPRG